MEEKPKSKIIFISDLKERSKVIVSSDEIDEQYKIVKKYSESLISEEEFCSIENLFSHQDLMIEIKKIIQHIWNYSEKEYFIDIKYCSDIGEDADLNTLFIIPWLYKFNVTFSIKIQGETILDMTQFVEFDDKNLLKIITYTKPCMKI